MTRRITLGALSVVVGLFVAHLGYAKVNLDDAVGIWLFDEGSGNTATDLSPAGNDGTLVKGPKWVDGKFGKALEFNGKDACVTTDQQLLESVPEFTIVAWIRPAKMGGSRIGLIGQNDTVEFGLINPTTLEVWSEAAGTGLDVPYGFPPDEWHHVAAVGTTKALQLYIDGQVNEKPVGVKDHGSSKFNVNIGGCGIFDGTGNFYTGVIDDVAIFHAALAAADIDDIMTNGLGKGLGVLAVEPTGKLAVTWGTLKAR